MGEYPVVMTIAGSDSGGGAGIQADLKTFAALGVHGTCAITSVTSQNTTGVLETYDMPPGVVASQISAVAEDMKIAFAKTGMVSSSNIIKTIVGKVREYDIPLVVDPVMAAEAGGRLLHKEAVQTLQEELIPLARVVTPNIGEAEVLSGLSINNRGDAIKAAGIIKESGASAVIVTGGHLDGSDVLVTDHDYTIIEGELVKGGTHGAGCTYSAALAVFLAKGDTIIDAAKKSKVFVTRAIREGRAVGRNVIPVNATGHMLRASWMREAQNDVSRAILHLESSEDFAILIPEVGCNVVSAIDNAASANDVCGVRGRIVRLDGHARAVGCPAFGSSSHMARIVLAAIHYDPGLRGAINIRYSREILNAIETLGMTVASFDREHEPPGTKTMEWGTSSAIESYMKQHGSIPHVIYDLGAVGKEPMIRLLAPSAAEAARKAVRIAAALKNLHQE